jgi:hypothetical protein
LALGRYRLHLQPNLGRGWWRRRVPLFWPAFLPMGLMKILLLGMLLSMLMFNRFLLQLL